MRNGIVVVSFFLSSVCFTQDYQFKEYTFPVNNDCPRCFGHVPAHDVDVGPMSITIDDDYAYIVDTYHANIKRINLETGDIFSSPKISTLQQPWLRDVAIFNNKVYVSSDLDSVFVLSKELQFLNSIYIGKGQKYFSHISKDKLEIYINIKDKIVEIDLEHNVSKFQDQYIYNIVGTPNGKKYKVYEKDGKEYIETEYGIVELKSPFRKIFMNYDASNVNFDSESLVYFNLNQSKLTLYVYRKKD